MLADKCATVSTTLEHSIVNGFLDEIFAMADPRKESFDEENSARQDDKSLLGHDMRSDFHHNQKTGGRGVVVTLLSLAVFINLMWSASLMLATVHQRPDRATTEAPKPEWLDLIYCE